MYDFDKSIIRINSCGFSDCPPEWSWDTAERGFDDYDLWAVFRGRGTLSHKGSTLDVSAGTALLLTPGIQYHGRHDKADPLYTIHFHFDIIESGKKQFPFDFQAKIIRDMAFFRDLLDRAVTCFYRNDAPKAEFWLKAALVEFSDEDGRAGSEYSGIAAGRIFKMWYFINESPENIPSLSSFASEFGYSEAYLGKLFHKITGVSYTEYAANVKINKAKFLLKSSDYTIETIASMLGYCDSGFFVRQFGKYTGMTPGKYRRS